jgi:hypothetical protein
MVFQSSIFFQMSNHDSWSQTPWLSAVIIL